MSDHHIINTRDTHDCGSNIDLNHVPPDLSADDGLDQRVINAVLDEGAYDAESQRQKYRDTPFRRVKLSELRHNYERRQTRRALRLMAIRTEIEIDDEYMYQNDSPDLAWDMSKHYLDFLLVKGSDIGFHAILPNNANDLNFIFHMDLHQPGRTFKSKHAELDFTPDGRLLYIGRSRGKDEVWLAMAPLEYFNTTREHGESINPSPQQCLAGKHYWMIVMLFAYLHDTAFPGKAIYCTDPYPDLDNEPRLHVTESTNIL